MRGSTIAMSELAQLCRRIGISMEVGVDARRMWSRETERSSGEIGRQMRVVLDHVGAGETLTASLAKTGHYFPKLMHELVAIGESTGRLDEVFKRLADHYEGMVRLRRVYISGIIWPSIQLALALLVVCVLLVVIGMIGESGATSMMFGLSGFKGMFTLLAFVGLIAFGCVMLFQVVRRGLNDTPAIADLVMRIPVLGPCFQIQSLARMAWCLSIVYDTGMEIRRGMKASLDATNTVYFSGLKPRIDAELADGRPIHTALAVTGRFPHDFLDTVEVGEQSGKLGESLLRLSRQYEERAQASAATLVKVASFGTWGLVATFIIILIFRIALTYINTLYDLIG